MAQFDFFGTWNDWWGILGHILATKVYSLIPDLKYDKPEPLFVTKVDDSVKTMILDRRNGFIWSPIFSRFPLSMELIKEGQNAGKYFVSPTRGGPCLRLVLPPCYEEDRIIHLGRGMLSCPKWTITPFTKVPEKPSAELRLGFKEVKEIIKNRIVYLKDPFKIWIGQHGKELVEEGRAVIDGIE